MRHGSRTSYGVLVLQIISSRTLSCAEIISQLSMSSQPVAADLKQLVTTLKWPGRHATLVGVVVRALYTHARADFVIDFKSSKQHQPRCDSI